MGAELDRLEVQVEAQATKANNQLDKLVGKLDRVSSALSNLNSGGLTGLSNGVAKFAQASAQLSSIDSRKFDTIAKNIEKLSTLNTQQIYGAASSMKTLSTAINSLGGASAGSMQVAQVADSISKLGGAGVQKAITNLPALAAAMNNLMATLAKAPQVNQNIIAMTNALAKLASQGSKVGTVSNSLTKDVNKVGNAMSANTKKVKSFASVIGSLYQQFFWVSRGIDKLWDSIESSMSYVENLNYFNAAFGQVADAAVSQWEEAGYDSAEAYYNSFSDRAKELTSKMTGFNINDDGTLSATGEASLGINPSKLMNYQAMFAQMSSSMGVTSETSLKLSQALTEIGADLASVKNMDFDKVWTDMASGLAGMSRTLDKYGVNIRNVNLQQKLFDLGINENITNLNQNDKALLRTIILLDSTKYAWGDLADTLNQPANQMRLLESNISNLSRTVGNLFLPMLSKVLPYVNGLVIALQRLATWLGNLLGIDLSAITSGIGSSEVDFGSLLEDTDDLTGNLNDAAKAADKLKKGIRGFDELNVIATQEDSGLGDGSGGLSSGLLDAAFEDAFSEYQKAWDEAFANMENRAEEFADKIEKYFQPIKDIINDFAIGDFYEAGQDISGLITDFNEMLSRAIAGVDWDEIGSNIGEFLRGMEWLEIMESLKDVIWEAVKGAASVWFGMLKEAPFETSLITAMALWKFKGVGGKLSGLISRALKKKGVRVDNLGIKIAAVAITWEMGFDIGKEIGKALFPEDAEYYDNFKWFGDDGFFEEIFSSDFDTLFDALTEMSKQYDGFLGILDTIKEKTQGTSLEFEDLISSLFFGVDGLLNEVAPLFENWYTENVKPWFTEEKWEILGDNAKKALSGKWSEFTDWWENTGLYKWWTEDVEPFFSKDTWSWDGIKDGLTESWNNAITSMKGIWNSFATWMNNALSFEFEGWNYSTEFFGEKIEIGIPSFEITLGKLPLATYATGGFPEDGWFRASKGEYFGSFDDGTSVIANNEQIISGIANGVRDANTEQIILLREQNYLLQRILEKETGISASDIFRTVRMEANDYYNRTGNPAFG